MKIAEAELGRLKAIDYIFVDEVEDHIQTESPA